MGARGSFAFRASAEAKWAAYSWLLRPRSPLAPIQPGQNRDGEQEQHDDEDRQSSLGQGPPTVTHCTESPTSTSGDTIG